MFNESKKTKQKLGGDHAGDEERADGVCNTAVQVETSQDTQEREEYVDELFARDRR